MFCMVNMVYKSNVAVVKYLKWKIKYNITRNTFVRELGLKNESNLGAKMAKMVILKVED